MVEARPQIRRFGRLITPSRWEAFIGLRTYLSTHGDASEKQLTQALSSAKRSGEFLRLKAELARTQRNDDLRSENRALREALQAAEHEVTNLFALQPKSAKKRLTTPHSITTKGRLIAGRHFMSGRFAVQLRESFAFPVPPK